MIIRCPHCEHSRSVNESQIPPRAEVAACPKCGQRFRFRNLGPSGEQPFPPAEEPPAPRKPRIRVPGVPLDYIPGVSPQPEAVPRHEAPAHEARHGEPPYPAPRVERPQSAFREAAEQGEADIWDAVDALHERWEKQVDQNVAEVSTPRPRSLADIRASQEHLVFAEEHGHLPPEGEPHADGEPYDEGAAYGDDAAYGEGEAYDEGEAYGEASGQRPRLRVGYVEDQSPPPGFSRSGPYATDGARFAAAGQYAGAGPQTASARFSEEQAGVGAAPAWGQARPSQGEARAMPEDEAYRHEGQALPHGPGEPGAMPGYGEYSDAPPVSPEGGGHAQAQAAEADPYAHSFGPEPYDPEAGFAPPLGGSGVPFENAEKHGWGKAFMATVYAVMFQSSAFFAQLGRTPSLGPGYVFFLIMGYITIFGSVVWGKALTMLLPELGSFFITVLPLPALLVVAPLALGMALLFITGCMRLQLRILAPEKADFGVLYRIVAYSAAPFMLCIVPFAGPPLGACWWLFALLMGCRHSLRLSWAAAALVPLPPALLLLAGLGWFFFGSI
jgi:predicted Zn finger-like uncharacterized protein